MSFTAVGSGGKGFVWRYSCSASLDSFDLASFVPVLDAFLEIVAAEVFRVRRSGVDAFARRV